MAQTMRFSSSEPASLAEACKLAWHTFYGMQKASEDFENLRFEVWTVAISLDSLHSVGTTTTLIDRQPDRGRWALTFSKLLASLGSALRPLHGLVRLYLSSSAKERAVVKNWLTHPDLTYEGLTIQDFRRKLSMLVESMNVFLSCLTHAELARAKDVSETEEWRVYSEVTEKVLHKWDSDVASGIRRPADKTAQPIEPPGYVKGDVKSYLTPLLNNRSPDLGVQYPEPPPSPMPPRPREERQSQHPAGVMNLDDIENGFRSHMHAMRRIREQLRQQKMNNNHFSDQTSSHFPEMTNNALGPRPGGVPPPTPTIPTLQRNATESSQTDSSVDYADASSSGGSGSLQSSETGSVVSIYQNNADKDTKPGQQRSPAQHGRKRQRQAQYRFKTGLEDESSQFSDGSGSEELADNRSRTKSPLEQMLNAALFFDQY
jgi:hypothetical protein